MARKHQLFDGSSDSDCEFGVNKQYAQCYDDWRKKEEMQKLKHISESESSSSESDGEVKEDQTEEKKFLKTLNCLLSKDPKIYDEQTKFFEHSTSDQNIKPEKPKEKPMYFKDYERKFLLETNGQVSDDDECTTYKGPTYSEEQEDIKRNLKSLLKDSSDEDDDLLQIRKKTKEEEESEEADYLKWLKGQKEEVPDDVEKDMAYLHNYWTDPNIDNDEKFLKDYILNKEYLEKDDSGTIPTYDEILANGTLSDEEREVKEQEIFEHKYNFRFEEPDQEFIKRYPRTIQESLRRTENKRKIKREEREQRKKKEKEQKREELKRLKAMFREEKLGKWKEIIGDEVNVDENFIESDFDPDKHDEKMNEMFNDNYYSVEEGQKPVFDYDAEIDDENWDTWNGVGKKQTSAKNDNLELAQEPEEDNLSPNEEVKTSKLQFQKEMIRSTSSKEKKVAKKSLFAETISKPKPVFDPQNKTFDDYLEEYYKLDYEDIVGGMAVRFKYRNVVPNDFGLTIDEILAADDKELNQWCSVKKTCMYRADHEEINDVKTYKQKGLNFYKKQKILTSLFSDTKSLNNDSDIHQTANDNSEATNSNNVSTEGPAKRKRKKKKSKRLGNDNPSLNYDEGTSNMVTTEEVQNDLNKPSERSNSNDGEAAHSNNVSNESLKKRKRNRKRKYTGTQNYNSYNNGASNPGSSFKNKKFPSHLAKDKRLALPDERLKAYGINPKKFKNCILYSKKSAE